MTKQEREKQQKNQKKGAEISYAYLPVKPGHAPSFWAALAQLLAQKQALQDPTTHALLAALEIDAALVERWRDNTPRVIRDIQEMLKDYRQWLLVNAKDSAGYLEMAMESKSAFWTSHFVNKLFPLLVQLEACRQLGGWAGTAEFYLFVVHMYSLGRSVRHEPELQSEAVMRDTLAFVFGAGLIRQMYMTETGKLAIIAQDNQQGDERDNELNNEREIVLELSLYALEVGRWVAVNTLQPPAQGQTQGNVWGVQLLEPCMCYLEAERLAVELQATATNLIQLTYHTDVDVQDGCLQTTANSTRVESMVFVPWEHPVPLTEMSESDAVLWEILVTLASLLAHTPQNKTEALAQLDTVLCMVYKELDTHYPAPSPHVKTICTGYLCASCGYLDTEDAYIDSNRGQSYKEYLRTAVQNALRRRGLWQVKKAR